MPLPSGGCSRQFRAHGHGHRRFVPASDLSCVWLCVRVAVFVHQTAIESNGFRFLKEGERVKFDIVDSERGKQAVKVVSPTGEPLNRARSE